MSVWFGNPSIADLDGKDVGALNSALGMEMLELTETSFKGRMPVDGRTRQPAGVLHGGASVAFAETLASWASFFAVDRSKFYPVGMEINANHLRPVSEGWVYGEATPISLGRKNHVWDIRITNEAGKPVCVSRCTMAILETPSQY